ISGMLKHCLSALFLAACGLATASAQAFTALTNEDLSRQAEEFLQDQASAYPGEARIIVNPPDVERMPACAQSEVFLPSNGRLRSRMTIGLRCLAPSPWTSYTQVELSVEGQYYVASRSL